ncbi:hypothetical protein MVEN_01604600 [Mycena venus]|uniref:Uncharacterized protein n=1 Tax=Mycena venus TaxID=2733690 RepID=A0A8H6XSY1_9AGAR|nr:hypothetical protein MVEN_01604600 [Mycena venus]
MHKGPFIFQAPLTPENPKPPRRLYGIGTYYEIPCTGCGDRHSYERWTKNRKSCVRCVEQGLGCSHAKAPRLKGSKGLHVGKSPTEDALGTTLDPHPPTCKAHVDCCAMGSSVKGVAPADSVPSSSGGDSDEISEELRALDVEQRSAGLFASLRFQLKRVDELAATTVPATCTELQKCTRSISYKIRSLETLFIENV